MKKLLFALLSISNIYGYYDSEVEVRLACPCYEFEVEGRALYWQPYASNMHYLALEKPLVVDSPNWKIEDINPEYHWAYEVSASAFFHDSHTKTRLTWTEYHSVDTDSEHAHGSDIVGPFFDIELPFQRAKGRVDFRYYNLKLDCGIAVDFGCRFHTYLYSGVDSTLIKQHLISKYASEDKKTSRKIKTPSQFLGGGPQIGFDFSYEFWNGFEFNGGGKGSLLVGRLKNHTDFVSVDPLLTSPNIQKTEVKNRTQLVPALQGKLGIAYVFCVCDSAWRLEAGYEARVYINAIQSVDISSEAASLPDLPDVVGVFARTFQRTVSNFGVAGPYLNLDIEF